MKRRYWLQWAGSAALAVVLTGCSLSSDSPRSEPACIRDKTPFSLSADNYADVGKPGDAKGTSRPFVVVLDEQHSSRVGQVEIAIMLNRLYHNANLRHLALEGSVLEKPPPDLTWFTSLPDASLRRAVALRLLRQGEVSAAEFAAMVLPDFQLHPIEHDNEYQVDLSDAATTSYDGYLVAIAATTMTSEQIEQATALLTENRHEDAIRFIVDTNPWTSQRYQLLDRKTPAVTTNEMQKLGAELEAKAQAVDADVTDYYEEFQAARRFFDTAAQRSKTMTGKTADLATARVGDCAPIAMNIGAAHTTEVADLFSQRNMSYAVVSPLSLSSGSGHDSDLSTEVYDRKLKQQSVDPAGAIGAFLDGRRKPLPSSETDWFKVKAELSYAAVVIARAAAAPAAGKPPFNLDRKQLGLGRSDPKIDIDLSTITVVPSQADDKTRNVLFKVTLLEQNVSLWVQTAVVDSAVDFLFSDPRNLEQVLKQILDELKTESPIGETKPSAQPLIVTLADGVKAVIGQSREAVEAVDLI